MAERRRGVLSGRVRRTGGVLAATALLFLAACADEDEIQGERVPVRAAADREDRLAAFPPQLLPAPALNPAWPQSAGSASGGGLHPEFTNELVVIWSYYTGESVNEDWAFSVEPVVSETTVLLLDTESALHAIDRETGDRLWRTSVVAQGDLRDEGVGGGLAIKGDRVFVGTGFGELLALDIGSGEILWRAPTSAPVHAAPVVAGDVVAVVSRDDVAHAFDVVDGEPLWIARGAGATVAFLTGAAPATDAGILVAPFASGELVALRIDDGEELWRTLLTGDFGDSPLAAYSDITAAPVIADGRVYAGTRRGEFVATDLRTGDSLWQRPVGSLRAAWALGDSLFLVDVDATLLRVSAETGHVFWRQVLPAYEDAEDFEDPIRYAAPVVAGNQVLVVSTDGRLATFDADSGEPLRNVDLEDPALASPVVADGVLYVYLSDGTLLAVR